jgi:hypothetical protein
MKTLSLSVLSLAAMSAVASAGGTEGSIGVGAEYQINGLTGGVSGNYDLGKMHVGGFLGFDDDGDDNDTDYSLGARFYYHIGSTAMSDFGVGGSLGFYSLDGQGMMMDDRDTLFFLEPGFQIRAFITSNVALSFTAGIVLGLVDAEGVSIGGGQTIDTGMGSRNVVNAAAGVHYYFGD